MTLSTFHKQVSLPQAGNVEPTHCVVAKLDDRMQLPSCSCSWMRTDAVQEPESQYLRLEMFDVDLINFKQMAKVNPLTAVKGVTNIVHSKESMCKGQVYLRDVCVHKPGEELERWFPLGTDDWSADEGPVRCCAAPPICVCGHGAQAAHNIVA